MTILAYHGSGVSIDEFSFEFIKGNDELGSGFYFTTSIDEAKDYCTRVISGYERKLGGDDNPTIHVVELDIKNPLKSDQMTGMTARQVEKIIKASPILNEALENFGDMSFEPIKRIMDRAIEGYVIVDGETDTIKNLNKLSNDFFGDHIEAFNRSIKDVMGFDGVVHEWSDSKHFVAWLPEQIKIMERVHINQDLNKIRRGP